MSSTNNLPQRLRILEIGHTFFFYRAIRDQTDYFYAGHRHLRRKRVPTPFGLSNYLGALRRLRRGGYDLLVIHPTPFPAWHPRTFLPLLRDWHIFALPWLLAPYLLRIIHLFHDVPVIVVDFRDTFSVERHNLYLLDKARAYFKRELPTDGWKVFFKSAHWGLPGRRWRQKAHSQRRLAKLRPFSLGTGGERDLPPRPEATKTADVFFAGDTALGTSPRANGMAELKALAAEGYVIDIPEAPLPFQEFLHRMSSSWLAWSPSGYGWDCFRHYEAAAVGTVAVSDYPTIQRDMPFRDGEHCVFYSTEPGELSAAVRAVLADKARLETMAEAAYRHVRQHHTLQARAERVTLAVLGRRLDGTPAEPPPAKAPAGA